MHRGVGDEPGCPIFGSGSPATSRLRRGCIRTKAFRGAVAAARRRAVLAAGVVVGIWGTGLYFLSFPGSFCKERCILVISILSQKKK